jgi:hypothetical protein
MGRVTLVVCFQIYQGRKSFEVANSEHAKHGKREIAQNGPATLINPSKNRIYGINVF